MRIKPKALIGRYVRLKSAAFKKLVGQRGGAVTLENLFVVAAIAHGVDRLICYGGNLRLTVSARDLAIV